MTKRQMLVAVAACALLTFAGHSAASTAILPLTTYFHPGVRTAFDVLYYEQASDQAGEGRHYIATLEMKDDQEGVMRLQDVSRAEPVLEYQIDVEHGIGAEVGAQPHSALDDFFLDNYTDWCGKVHNGVRIKWQFCTGKDCPGGGLCIKHCVKVAGTCIP